MAQQELGRLTVMTDHILKTSLLEHARSNIVVEWVDLDKLIVGVLNRMKMVVEHFQILVSYRTSGSDFCVKGSVEHLSTLMYNLIDNAIKYRGDGGVIDIRLKDIGNSAEISVRDNGIGIPSEYQHKIFEKFFRVPHGDVHNIKGYGLGLSYVFEVVNMHSGDIKVESNPQAGSNFIIRLPKES